MKKTLFIVLLLASSCQTYDTDLNTQEKITVSSMTDIKRGETCVHNLFGGFSIPYIGDTAIKMSGDQSVITAIKKANITSIYAIDRMKKSYFFYSKRCTIVFGK